jgi:DNA-directed RNA polymerase specialized sigma24 family protein
MPAIDHFPSTHATWLDAQLTIIEDADRAHAAGDPVAAARAAEARGTLRRHVMERYTPALGAYVSSAGLRGAGERDELVAGFYAGPMADDAFFARWRASGMPLRRWLMNAISFHCRGLRRDLRRERGRTEPGVDVHGLPGSAAAAEADAAEAFDRAWALAIVNESYARVQGELADAGRHDDDAILRMHLIDGMPYEEIARQLGLTRTDCFNATRRVAARVREALRELLREEGVPNSGVDAAVAEVLRLVERG